MMVVLPIAVPMGTDPVLTILVMSERLLTAANDPHHLKPAA